MATVFAMVYVHSGVPWPADEITVSYGGQPVRLVPARRDQQGTACTFPIAAFEAASRADARQGLSVVRRFLSALAWREQTFLREVDSAVGPPLHLSTILPDSFSGGRFVCDDLVNPAERDARLALAFYRDGLSVRHTAFAFLSFFKIFNIRHPAGQAQIDCLTSLLPLLASDTTKQRVADLAKTEPSVAKYLYGSCRCAVAHAYSAPVVDPDDPEDDRRLSADLPIIRELAAHYMQRDLSLPRPRRTPSV